jgi:flavin-dependent dehydrogenase
VKEAEVAIVGGGPAGAALAIRLARAGHETVVFERLQQPRWRAAGVYSSPLTRTRLAALGVTDDELERLIRPISAMVVETADGRASCSLEYPAPHHACGVDRVRLEQTVLDHARRAGATVHEGAVVSAVEFGPRGARLTVAQDGDVRVVSARLVVGADGPHSIVARAAGMTLSARRFRQAALTVHQADPLAAAAGRPMTARMIVGRGWYCGLAPVPGGRVNVGIVMGERTLRRRLSELGGPAEIVARTVADLPGDQGEDWRAAAATDEVQVALPLLHRVRRAAGERFLLVGDACGFIDPLSGEGLHRALVSSELAARAIAAWSRGESSALEDYDHRLRARFRNKDALSWLLQLFLWRTELASYALRRLDRRVAERREFAAGLADLIPPSRLLDPRFIVRLLAP